MDIRRAVLPVLLVRSLLLRLCVNEDVHVAPGRTRVDDVFLSVCEL